MTNIQYVETPLMASLQEFTPLIEPAFHKIGFHNRAGQRHRDAVRRVHALRIPGRADHRGRGPGVDGAQPALGRALRG